MFVTLKIEEEIKKLDAVIEELQRKRDKESGNKMQEFDAKVNEHQKAEALAQSAVDNKKEGLKAEQKKKKELSKHNEDVRL